jgi:hypothetical protein
MAAEQEYPEALCNLGLAYEHGYAVKPSLAKAEKCYKQAAELGDCNAPYFLGCLYEKSGNQDPELAFHYFQAAAGLDNEKAMYKVAAMLREGIGTEQDYVRAVQYYRQAAERGYARAQNDLAIMYKNGIGVHQSYEKAAMYFKLAAEQGHPRAISYLSMFYELGLGVTKDLRLAREYFEKSASLGFEFSE